MLKNAALFLAILLLPVSLSGCGKRAIDVPKAERYGVNEFTDDLRNKGYQFDLTDAQEDFLPTTRKRITIGSDTLDIYVYKNSRDMEEDSKRISADGSRYTDDEKSMTVEWISYPHFYEKGSIIIQYIGTNEKILSDLKAICGNQFAGYQTE